VIARAIAALLICAAGAASAQGQPTDLTDFMGAHGCTFGATSIAAAEQAGFARAEIDAAISAHLADGSAAQQGDYVVLDVATCTIRLPDIQTDLHLTDPDILAITTTVDAFAKDGSPGCFLRDGASWFENSGRSFEDYAQFVAAHIIKGDVRFYSTSPLRTPVTFQVVSGACSNVPDIAAMRANHTKLITGFDSFVRHQGATNACLGEDVFFMDTAFAFALQGGDPAKADVEVADINAWLWMEYLMIAFAADWVEGDTWTEKGTMHPPMCHY
jgi:hypothetical protein